MENLLKHLVLGVLIFLWSYIAAFGGGEQKETGRSLDRFPEEGVLDSLRELYAQRPLLDGSDLIVDLRLRQEGFLNAGVGKFDDDDGYAEDFEESDTEEYGANERNWKNEEPEGNDWSVVDKANFLRTTVKGMGRVLKQVSFKRIYHNQDGLNVRLSVLITEVGAYFSSDKVYDSRKVTTLMREIRDVVRAGADVNTPDHIGRTALMCAAMVGDAEIAKEWIDGGIVDVNGADDRGHTALIWSAIYRKMQVFALLIQAKANVNAISEDGSMALMCAATQESVDMLLMLLEAGVDLSARSVSDSYEGFTALMWAAKNGGADVLLTLLVLGADVNASDDAGVTPLMVAIRAGRIDQVNILLAYGADFYAKDNEGSTVLLWAVKWFNVKVFNRIKDLAADHIGEPNDKGESPAILLKEQGIELDGYN